MSQMLSGSPEGGAPTRAPLLTTLSSRSDFPSRTRRLLSGVLGLTTSTWTTLVEASVSDFEQLLFKRAEKSKAEAAQKFCFETLREIRRVKAEILPRFLAAVEDAFARIDWPAPAATQASGPVVSNHELALVETGELDESLALQDLAVKAEIRHTMALYTLGYRFGVLIAAPALDAESLPIGPHRLGAALRHAISHTHISTDHRVFLYQTFDRVAMAHAGSFYEAVNTYLIEHRIFSHLKVLLLRARPAPVNSPEDAPAKGRTGGANTKPESAVVAKARALAASPPEDERDSELFTMLRELLAGRRHALGAATPEVPQAGSYVPTGDELQSVLGMLQTKPIAPIVLGDRLVPRAVSQVKHDLIAHLRQLTSLGANTQLAGEDSDTIDLVGMLFDRILQEIKPDSSTQAMLTKLQVPLLRVALSDKSFFTRRAHPARQLLNTIAETGARWADDGDGKADRALVDKMQLIIDRVTSEYDGDITLIETLLADLSRHMRTIARKAEVSERRHIDAAKGREKLALARQTASAAVARRIAAAKPKSFVRTLLEQAWTDVLALTLLRHGEQSKAYAMQLGLADKLIASAAAKNDKSALSSLVRTQVASSLSAVGYAKDDIENVVRRLTGSAGAADEDEPVSRTEMAIKLKKKPHLGIATARESQRREPLKPAPKLQLSEAEQRMVEHLKTLPFGTWFEFNINQQGDFARRKLSWYSPVTGHCLFVTQRGVRSEERGLEQLARDLSRGHVRLAKPDEESLVDRAWRAILTSLRQLAGRAPATAHTRA